MSVSVNASVGPQASASAASSSSSSVQDIRSQQQDLRLQQQSIQQQIVSGQISPEQGQNKILDLENKVKDLDNKVLDANNAANSAAQNGGAQTAAPPAPAGYSGASSFEPAPRAKPPVVIDPLGLGSGGGSKPGLSSGAGQGN